MENLKVKISSEAESKEAQELFFELGAKPRSIIENWKNEDYKVAWFALGKSGELFNEVVFRGSDSGISYSSMYKEITLPELRDIVVLKRNDVGDATHESHCGELKFILLGDWWNLFTGGKWQQFSHKQSPRCNKLKPIEKPMKEYLDKQQDGTYKLIKADGGCIDRDWIEIPTGAEKYIQLSGNNRSFYKNGFKEFWCSGKWLETACNKENLKTWNGFPVLWQRNPEPKQAEFLVKTDNGYVLQVLDENAGGEDVVLIPDGAVKAYLNNSKTINFVNADDDYMNSVTDGKWVDTHRGKHDLCGHILVWKRETLNDQVASAEEYREMISNAAIAQSCSGGASRNASSQGQSEFPLNNYELNHRVAKAFNAVRGTDLNEDDVNYIRELINLTISHYGERK